MSPPQAVRPGPVSAPPPKVDLEKLVRPRAIEPRISDLNPSAIDDGQPRLRVPRAVSPLANGLTPPSSESRTFDRIPVPEARGALVRSLPTNNGSWLAAWNVVGSAKQHLDVSYFIFNRDVFGRAYLGKLLRKQREGVQVRLLLDATGDTLGTTGFTSKLRGQDYLQELVAAGGRVSIYNPLHLKLPKQALDMSSAAGISANHDKIVASERYAITGGRNVADEYFSDPIDHPEVFRDGDVLIDSPAAAAQLSRAVRVEMDRRDLTMPITADMFGNWSTRDAELLGTAAMMDAWLARAPLSESDKRSLRSNENARNALAETLITGAIADAQAKGTSIPSRSSLRDSARELVTNLELAGKGRGYDINAGMTRGDVKILDRTSVNTGARGHDEIAPGIGAVIDGAQDYLLITNPYVALSEPIREKLEAAGRRGVRIDLLTNSPSGVVGAVSQAWFINEWPQLLARIPNLRIFVFTGEGELHAKTGVADGEIASIGSSNLDIISSDINGEVIALTRSRELARSLEDSFRADMADPRNNVREYTIERDASGRPLLRNGKPIIKFGPDDHSTWTGRQMTRAIGGIATYATRLLPQLSPLTESQPRARTNTAPANQPR